MNLQCGQNFPFCFECCFSAFVVIMAVLGVCGDMRVGPPTRLLFTLGLAMAIVDACHGSTTTTTIILFCSSFTITYTELFLFL